MVAILPLTFTADLVRVDIPSFLLTTGVALLCDTVSANLTELALENARCTALREQESAQIQALEEKEAEWVSQTTGRGHKARL
jgi:hypothetical protein